MPRIAAGPARSLPGPALAKPTTLPEAVLRVGRGPLSMVIRPRGDFRAADGNHLHFQLQRLTGPAVVGINDHHVLAYLHDTDQAAATPAVPDPHPLTDGEVFVSREPRSGQAVDPAGVDRSVGPLGGHDEPRAFPRRQSDQRQAQPGQPRMVDADG